MQMNDTKPISNDSPSKDQETKQRNAFKLPFIIITVLFFGLFMISLYIFLTDSLCFDQARCPENELLNYEDSLIDTSALYTEEECLNMTDQLNEMPPKAQETQTISSFDLPLARSVENNRYTVTYELCEEWSERDYPAPPTCTKRIEKIFELHEDAMITLTICDSGIINEIKEVTAYDFTEMDLETLDAESCYGVGGGGHRLFVVDDVIVGLQNHN